MRQQKLGYVHQARKNFIIKKKKSKKKKSKKKKFTLHIRRSWSILKFSFCDVPTA